jgi:hypothetical protein
MRSGTVLVFAAALGAGTLAIPRDAHAIGPVDVEAGARVGGGTSPFSSQPSPLGFGLGGRAGASFLGYYAGLSLMYYFGDKTNDASNVSRSEHAWFYGGELGYGTKLLGALTLRGTLGIGDVTVNYKGPLPKDLNNLYLEPCFTALVSFGFLYVGADASVIVLPSIGDPSNPTNGSSWDAAFTAHGQLGVTF